MGRNGNFHGGNRNRERMMHEQYIKYVAPNLIASFCLVLYENTDMSVDDITYLVEQITPLWNRSNAEGWNIRENCKELLGIDVMHELEAKEKGING